jgi:hypothetical protein
MSADLVAGMEPNTGNTSSLSNWRFAPGQVFNGVAGALDGVARLSFTAASDGLGYACSGSLLAGGQYVLTASHCADDFTSMTVQFGWYNGTAQVTRSVSVSDVYLNPQWNGTLDTGADIALIKLERAGHQHQRLPDLHHQRRGQAGAVAGYGTTSVGSSNSATNWNDGNYGHYAYNTYDVLSSTFNRDIGTRTINGEQWSYDPSFTWAAPTCRTSTARAMPATTPWVCWPPVRRHLDQRRRPGCERRPDRRRWTRRRRLRVRERPVGGVGVHSWGWNNACSYFGLTSCAGLNGNSSSYGDLSGSTATFSHADWIASIAGAQVVAVPEPQTHALLLAGLAVVGSLARRRRRSGARSRRGPRAQRKRPAGRFFMGPWRPGASVSVCRKAAMSATSCALSTGGSPGWPPKGGSLLRLAW